MTLLDADSLYLVESSVKNKGGDDGVRTWSTAAQILLPVAALAILWGRRGFFARFFLQFDKNCVSVFCPSFSQRQRLLKWASGRLPPTWSSQANTFPEGPAEFWRDGSLLCTLVNSAIPGACPNPHRHWKRPPSHGQALAYKYLGVIPVFTETELSQNTFTSRHERVLLDYLLRVQEAVTKISLNDLKYSSRFAARGMGLVVGEQQRKTAFYIYSSSTTSSSKHDVMVLIRGPYNTHCTVTIPAHYISKKHFKNHFDDKRRLAFQSRAQKSFFRSLSVDLGSFINVNQKQAIFNNIPIKLVSENERVKVVFIPKTTGIHEISIITNGFHLLGSPFSVNVAKNTSGIIDTFSENMEHPYTKRNKKSTRRKIISKVIDFIDEKVSYENLKIIPLYIRSIPKIKISESKDFSQENCLQGKNLTDVDITENQSAKGYKQNLTNSTKVLINLNFKEFQQDSTNEINTRKDCEKNIIKIDSEVTKNNILCTESNVFQQSLNKNHKMEDVEKIDADFNDDLISPIKPQNDDFNNNSVCKYAIDSPIVENLNNPDGKSIFTISPICLDHIEEEVSNDNDPKEAPEVPKRNFERRHLKRQSSIDILDILDKNEYEEKLEGEKSRKNLDIIGASIILDDDPRNDELEPVLSNYKVKNQLNNSKFYEPFEKQYEDHYQIQDSSPVTTSKLIKNEKNKNLEENQPINLKIDNKTNNECKKDSKFLKSHHMNILNFLSSLKIEDSPNTNAKPTSSSPTKTEKSRETSHSHDSNQEVINFKERLRYWEIQTNLYNNETRKNLKIRRSLPNLFAVSDSEFFLFIPPVEKGQDNFEDYRFQDNREVAEFKSLFKERQEYWKALSSQSASHTSLSSSLFYLESIVGKKNNNNIKARRSLPDLFSKSAREEVLNEMSYRNLCFPVDFFDSPEAVKFKTRFKECQEFWERLSSQNLDFKGSFYEYIDPDDDSKEGHFEDENFDSGFYSSLPNLSTKNQHEDISDSFIEYPDSLKYKIQYEKRRDYWEKLSLHTLSDASLSSLIDTDTKPVLKRNTTNKSQKMSFNEIKNMNEKQQRNYGTNLNIARENILYNDHSLRNKQETNLTDDLKHINDQRERMKTHFKEAKKFFKGLEENDK